MRAPEEDQNAEHLSNLLSVGLAPEVGCRFRPKPLGAQEFGVPSGMFGASSGSVGEGVYAICVYGAVSNWISRSVYAETTSCLQIQ